MELSAIENFRRAETRRVIEYALDNPGDWAFLCNGDGSVVEPGMILTQIGKLEQHQLYYLIPVLVTNFHASAELQHAVTQFIIDKMFGGSEETALQALCNDLINKIKKNRPKQ